MKSPSTHHQTRRGFTLIELLVVVAIIVVLAAMGFGVGASAIKRAKNLTDRAAATSLSQAIEGYFDEYSTLPSDKDGDDDETTSEEEVMNRLMAFGSDEEIAQYNPKSVRYFSGKAAKGTDRDKAYGGLFYTNDAVVLFNAWKPKSTAQRQSRYYQIKMDTDYDDEIVDPFNSDRSIYNRRALIWSMGADGEESSGDQYDEKNRDNIYSWKN